MFSNGSNNHSRTLPFGLFGQYTSHECAVIIIQMADRFIQKNEIERLAESTNKSYALLLPER